MTFAIIVFFVCENYSVRIVGLDVGERRIGVAISDATGTLARPVSVLAVSELERDGLRLAAAELARLAALDDAIESIVVGVPRRLDGSANNLTDRVTAFGRALEHAAGIPIVFQDERLTSREAESRLAVTDRDWRSRKARLDAAAAAIILQDYLDVRPGRLNPLPVDPEI